MCPLTTSTWDGWLFDETNTSTFAVAEAAVFEAAVILISIVTCRPAPRLFTWYVPARTAAVMFVAPLKNWTVYELEPATFASTVNESVAGPSFWKRTKSLLSRAPRHSPGPGLCRQNSARVDPVARVLLVGLQRDQGVGASIRVGEGAGDVLACSQGDGRRARRDACRLARVARQPGQAPAGYGRLGDAVVARRQAHRA